VEAEGMIPEWLVIVVGIACLVAGMLLLALPT